MRSALSPGVDLSRPPLDQVSRLARTGAKWLLCLHLARYGIGTASTIVLARLLSPLDFGVIGMAATLTTFCQVFADFGLGWATVQRRDISRDQINNLFWINSLVGAALWGSCIAAGPWLNFFFGRTDLARIAAVLGSGLLSSAMAAQPMALLRRQMRLKVLASIQIVSVMGGSAVGVGMALAGLRYWSIVGQILTTQFAALFLVILQTGFHVGLPRRHSGTLALVKFGGYLTAFGFLSFLAKSVDNVVVGRVLGAEQLGYYTRAYFLMTLPVILTASALTDAIMPALAALKQQPGDFARTFRRATTAVAYIAFPIIAGMAVTSTDLILVVYGPKWVSVAPMLVVLCAGGIFYSVQTFSWLYVVNGKERELFMWGVVVACSLVPSFLIGVRWGALGVAAAYSIVTACILTPAGFYLSHRSSGIPLLPTVKVLARPLLSTAVMVFGVRAVRAAVGGHVSKPLPLLLLEMAVGVAIYVALCARDMRALYAGSYREAGV